jgi:hypothetical protein
MSPAQQKLTHHPAPHADRVASWESLLGLFGGPVAWFLQLCALNALADQPCFHSAERALQPLSGQAWTTPAMGLVAVLALLVALASFWLSWRAYQRTAEEQPGGHEALLEIGAGRTRFLALWGMVFGAGFALTIIANAIGQTVLPRCAG